jgi:carbon storage regulator
MLVLTRKKDQTLVIADNIEITVLDIQDDQIRFGINAPKSVKIYRKEIYLEIMQENKNAAMQAHANPRSLSELIKPDINKIVKKRGEASITKSKIDRLNLTSSPDSPNSPNTPN